jgi:hypothetical protein
LKGGVSNRPRDTSKYPYTPFMLVAHGDIEWYFGTQNDLGSGRILIGQVSQHVLLTRRVGAVNAQAWRKKPCTHFLAREDTSQAQRGDILIRHYDRHLILDLNSTCSMCGFAARAYRVELSKDRGLAEVERWGERGRCLSGGCRSLQVGLAMRQHGARLESMRTLKEWHAVVPI